MTNHAGCLRPGSPRTGLRPWGGDPAFQTRETTNSSRASAARLAGQSPRRRVLPGRPVLADNYLPPAHNLNQWSERERGQTVVECQKRSSRNRSNLSGMPPVYTGEGYPHPPLFIFKPGSFFADYFTLSGFPASAIETWRPYSARKPRRSAPEKLKTILRQPMG